MSHPGCGEGNGIHSIIKKIQWPCLPSNQVQRVKCVCVHTHRHGCPVELSDIAMAASCRKSRRVQDQLLDISVLWVTHVAGRISDSHHISPVAREEDNIP